MTLRIDIVSDVMCPWCVIGYHRLARALEETGAAHELHWHPFELNPQMPPEGQNMREHVIEKYGSTLEASDRDRDHITALGADLGFDFRFTDDSRMHNTFQTHQLLHWADTQGAQHALELALFTAHFTHQRDLSNADVLAEIAAETGFARDEARAVLADQRFAAEVREMEDFWLSKGIRGVPSVIFNLRDLVTGAQGVENYTRMIEESANQEA